METTSAPTGTTHDDLMAEIGRVHRATLMSPEYDRAVRRNGGVLAVATRRHTYKNGN